MALLSDNDVFGSPSGGLLSDDDVFGAQPKKQNKGIAGDIATGLKRGVEQIPGMVTGLADIAAAPVSAVTGINRPFSRGADYLGEKTGFQPGKWSDQAAQEYSPEMQRSLQNVQKADGFVDTLGAIAQNPRAAVNLVAESLPSTLAGGILARGAMGAVAGAEKLAAMKAAGDTAGLMKAGAIAGGIGEGAVTAGQQMAQTDYGADPLRAAGAATAAGIGTGIIGGVSGRVANKLGLADIEGSIASGTLGAGKKAGVGAYAGRIAGGAAQEGLIEELPQSAQEQIWQNVANSKPWDEGVGSAAAQGLVAGMAMGAGVNAMPGSKYVESKRQPTEDKPEIAGLLPAPSYYTGTPGDRIISADTERQAAIDAADANAAAVYAAREAFEKQLRQSVNIVNEPAPLQQRIDELLNVDQGRMTKAERSAYEKELAAAFSEPIGVRHDANQNEVPFTIGEYLDAQSAAEDAVRSRPLKQNAVEQSGARLQQVADEETSGYVAPEIPVVGTLSAVANMAIKSGAHAQNQMQQAMQAALAKQGKPEKANGPIAAATDAQVATQAPQANDAQAAPAGQFDVSQRTDGQLAYLSQNGKPGWKESAIAEMQRRGNQAGNALNATNSASTVALNEQQASPVEQQQAPVAQRPNALRESAERRKGNAARDDLVGAIMRVTGGRGIAANMAQTVVGDKANNATKVRGLFTNVGIADLDDTATLLRDEEGYDVRDGNHLAELIRSQADGNPVYSTARIEREAAAEAEKRHRDEIRSKAKKFGIKTVARPFGEIEKEVLRRIDERHTDAVNKLDARARSRFDAMLRHAVEVADFDEVDAIITDAQNRFIGREFFTQATRQLRGYIDDLTRERQAQEQSNAIEETQGTSEEPDWLRSGTENPGGRSDPAGAPESARRQAGQQEAGLTLEGQTNEQAAEQFAQQQAGDSAEITKEQADRERDAVPFAMQQQSQPKPQGVQTGLFTADGRPSVASKHEQAQGDLVGASKKELDSISASIEEKRGQLVAIEDKIVGAAGLASGFIEDALRSRKVSAELKGRRQEIRAELADLRKQYASLNNQNNAQLEQEQANTSADSGNYPEQFKAGELARKRGEARALPLSLAIAKGASREMQDAWFAGFDKGTTKKSTADQEPVKNETPSAAAGSAEAEVKNQEPIKKQDQATDSAPQQKADAAPEAKPTPAVDAEKQAESKSPAAIGDFGEKIGGAKKDLWTGYKEKLTGAEALDIKAEPLSKSWPVPDYESLIESGVDSFVVAFVRAARDSIPRKPTATWKLKSWAGGVEFLRDTSKKLIDGELSATQAKELLQKAGDVSRGMRDIAGRIELYQLVGHRQSLDGFSLSHHFYTLYKGKENVSLWAVEKEAKATAFSNWPAEFATGATKQEALDKFKALYDKTDFNQSKSNEVTFDLYSQGGKFYVGKKMGRNITQLAGPFDTIKETRAYRDDHHDELVSRLEKAKEIPKLRRDRNEPRVGEDMRDGQDVTPEMFAESFGFKGVEFGNWVEQKKRQKDLNESFDALMDMAAILNIPPKALSLNGQLGLAFGARGTGGIDPAAAHYERSFVAINLTKKEGAGSLGHEWFHALDNYFSRLRGKGLDMMTEALDVSLAGRGSDFIANTAVRKEMILAFGRVVNSIKMTALRERSAKLDNKRSKAYWTTTPEMSARAFESYLISKLHDQNASNDYLANIVDPKTWEAAESLGFELDDSYPYPTAGEMPLIREAFDKFFQTVETKETDRGVMLYNQASLGKISPADKSIYGMATEGKSAADILKFIASASRNPMNRQLAKLLLKTGIAPSITVGDGKGWKMNAGEGHKYAAAYNPKTDTVALFRPASAERHVLHELIHAATLRALGKKSLASAQMKALFAHVQKSGLLTGQYGMANVDEFVAEVFSNPKFQQMLKQVSAPQRNDKPSSAWDWFVRVVRGILGVPQGQENALSRAIELGVGVMREDMKIRRSEAGVQFSEIAGDEIEKAFGRTIQEKARNWMKARLQGKLFQNDATGWDISVGRKGVGKVMMHAAKDVHSRSVVAIPDLIKNAVLVASEANRNTKERDDVPMVHHFYAPLRVGGSEYVARLVVKETRSGQRFYDFDTSDEISPAVLGETHTLSQTRGAAPSARLDMSMAELLSYVKAEHGGTDPKFIRYAAGPKQTDSAAFRKWFGKSKVVDENGQPLVVYHGTSDDFTVFGNKYAGRTWEMFSDSSEYSNRFASSRGGRLVPVYLSLRNPLDMRSLPAIRGDVRNKLIPLLEDAGVKFGNNFKMSDLPYERDLFQIVNMAGHKSGFADAVMAAGYDGIIMPDNHDGDYLDDGGIIATTYIALNPGQIKSAIGNSGDFDGTNPDIRYNVADEGWSVSEPSKMDDLIYAMQDKQIDMRRVVQSIMRTGKKVKDEVNAYLQEELFHGRAAKGVKDFLDFELRPLLKQMQEAKVDMGDFEEYLWNRHAEERNKQIAKINPDMPDGGSGIETAKARAYLAGLSAEQRKTFEALAAKVETMNRESQRVLVESGLEKQSTIDAWNGAYQHYVPLQREDVDSGHVGTGKGFSVRGSSSKRAMGSGKKVVDIIANLTMQRERNIVRAEKNRVSNALLGLAVQNPNPDFWKVDQAPKERVVQEKAIYTVLDSDGNKIEEFTRMDDAERLANKTPGASIDQTWGDRVTERVTPGFTSRDNVLLTRINGEDHYVIFNERDERAMRMATAMKSLDMDNLGRVLSVVGKATRYLASINTQYNPIFGVINLVRDTQGALINLSSTPLAGEQKRVLGYTKDALVGIYKDIRAHRSGAKPSSNWAALFEEFQKEGGQTGYRDQYANAEARAESIKSELEQFKDGKAKQLARGLFGWLSDYNETMENAVRLAAYKAAKEKGMSNQQAASLAKNITVNFNRKGQMATQVGALYAFYNASVQGSARIAETLFEQNGGDIKNVRLSKKGKQILAGGIMLGAMQALLLAAAGFDDDEPPEFIRERNLILPIGGGKYLTLAMPLGLHVIPGIGRIATEFVLSGGKDPLKRIAAFGSMFADAFNPVGSAGWSLQTITPSVVDPFAALAENKDFTGKEIYREDFNKLNPTPGHARAKDVATFYSRWISEAMNFMTGGTEFKPGLISWSPDSIDYLVSQAGGGVMREANKVLQTTGAAYSGEDLPLYKIPLVGRFVGDTAGQSGQSAKFYDAIKQINMHEAQYKGLIKDGRSAEAREYLAENPAVKLIMAGNHAELAVRKLRTMKRDLVENEADPAKVRAIDDRITATMRAFNERAQQVI